MIRFIAGFPCSRKTSFGDWLRDHRGYLHVDMEGQKFAQSYLHPIWDRALAARDVSPFLEELVRLHPRVVLTWGFPHDCCWAPHLLRDHGVRLAWFDADPDAARAAWIKREGTENTSSDEQFAALRDHRGDFVAPFEGSIVSVLSSAGVYKDFIEIADVIGIPGPAE